jgi:hypothetical protein
MAKIKTSEKLDHRRRQVPNSHSVSVSLRAVFVPTPSFNRGKQQAAVELSETP